MASIGDQMVASHQHILQQVQAVVAGDTDAVQHWPAICRELEQAVAFEEAEVFPVVRWASWTGGTAVYEFRYQHSLLFDLCRELLASAELDQRLREFQDKLREHFAGEEMLLGPLLPGEGA